MRSKCGSVEVAFDAERADSTPGFPEVKQEYVTRRFWIYALSKIKTVLLIYSLFHKQVQEQHLKHYNYFIHIVTDKMVALIICLLCFFIIF